MNVDQQLSTPSPQFMVTVLPQRERAVVVPRGELDIATTDRVEAQVLALCERGFDDLCLDLSALTFFDSTALRLLVRLDAELGERGCRFSIVPGDGAASRVLELTGMLGRFERAAGAVQTVS